MKNFVIQINFEIFNLLATKKTMKLSLFAKIR
jgi:hypothetical protein